MKKLITILTITCVGAFAFAAAPTDTEKQAFQEYVKANVTYEGGNFMQTVEAAAKADVVKPIATWAQEDAAAFGEYLKALPENGYLGNGYIWVIRKAVNKDFDAGTIKDAVINDYAATNKLANSDKSYFAEIKAKGFIVAGGVRMSEWQIFNLGVKYADMDCFNLVDEKFIAQNFDKYLAAVRSSRLDAKSLYELYAKITQNYAPYKDSIKLVSDNWEALQTDKNEAFMNYYAEKKLEALSK